MLWTPGFRNYGRFTVYKYCLLFTEYPQRGYIYLYLSIFYYEVVTLKKKQHVKECSTVTTIVVFDQDPAASNCAWLMQILENTKSKGQAVQDSHYLPQYQHYLSLAMDSILPLEGYVHEGGQTTGC